MSFNPLFPYGIENSLFSLDLIQTRPLLNLVNCSQLNNDIFTTFIDTNKITNTILSCETILLIKEEDIKVSITSAEVLVYIPNQDLIFTQEYNILATENDQYIIQDRDI
jgi:hypothetical protein